MEPMMTRKEAAAYLKVTICTISNMMRRGELPYSKVSNRILIRERDIQKVVDDNRSIVHDGDAGQNSPAALATGNRDCVGTLATSEHGITRHV